VAGHYQPLADNRGHEQPLTKLGTTVRPNCFSAVGSENTAKQKIDADRPLGAAL
jgi:hypothetical protein